MCYNVKDSTPLWLDRANDSQQSKEKSKGGLKGKIVNF